MRAIPTPVAASASITNNVRVGRHANKTVADRHLRAAWDELEQLRVNLPPSGRPPRGWPRVIRPIERVLTDEPDLGDVAQHDARVGHGQAKINPASPADSLWNGQPHERSWHCHGPWSDVSQTLWA